MKLKPIGIIRNKIRERKDISIEGAASRIVLLPRYRRALLHIERHSHLWVICWLHKADRGALRVIPRKISSALGESGVFALRSPDRPNPISISCVRLRRVRGNILSIDPLDVINGTPVVDLKPYSPGIDSVPVARMPDYSRKYRLVSDRFLLNTLRAIVRNHCGRLNQEGRAAAELTFNWIRETGKAPSPRARLRTNLTGDGVDALCALFRLKPSQNAIRFPHKNRTPGPRRLEVRYPHARTRLVHLPKPGGSTP